MSHLDIKTRLTIFIDKNQKLRFKNADREAGGEQVGVSGDVVLRFHLVLKQAWDLGLADKQSEAFTSTSTRLSEEISKLYLNVAGRQEVVVAEFRYRFTESDPALFDLRLDYPIRPRSVNFDEMLVAADLIINCESIKCWILHGV